MTASRTSLVSARRAARHPKVAHLIAVDESGIAELEALVATLPMCATGRIFVEVADASQIGHIAAPDRMTVTWLDRSRRSGAVGTGERCAQGVALTRAVRAWAGEMMCDEDDETNVTVLTGYLATADIVEYLRDELEHSMARVHVPASYNLV